MAQTSIPYEFTYQEFFPQITQGFADRAFFQSITELRLSH